MIDIIYLPAACVRSIGKNQQREQVIRRVSFVNQNLSNAPGQTDQFLRQFGV
jgi:hypothetical protein